MLIAKMPSLTEESLLLTAILSVNSLSYIILAFSNSIFIKVWVNILYSTLISVNNEISSYSLGVKNTILDRDPEI